MSILYFCLFYSILLSVSSESGIQKSLHAEAEPYTTKQVQPLESSAFQAAGELVSQEIWLPNLVSPFITS